MSRTFTYPDLGDDPVAGYRDIRVPRTVKVAANVGSSPNHPLSRSSQLGGIPRRKWSRRAQPGDEPSIGIGPCVRLATQRCFPWWNV